jgi:hypothetical protein
MAIVGAALRSRDFHEEAGRSARVAGARSHAPRLLTICAILCSLSFAGCARNPPQREAGPALRDGRQPAVRAASRTRRPLEQLRYVEPNIRRPSPALLSPQPAPDCEFNRSDLKTVDPDGWARLKAEYERQCYRDAEKQARDRLALLQASSTCEIEPVQQSRPPRSQPTQPR